MSVGSTRAMAGKEQFNGRYSEDGSQGAQSSQVCADTLAKVVAARGLKAGPQNKIGPTSATEDGPIDRA